MTDNVDAAMEVDGERVKDNCDDEKQPSEKANTAEEALKGPQSDEKSEVRMKKSDDICSE